MHALGDAVGFSCPLEKALDWLCVNIPESRLPALFAPGRGFYSPCIMPYSTLFFLKA